MCPNRAARFARHPLYQRGFLMPLAMFILVALASLAIAANRLNSSSFSSSVQTAINVQSLYAADSGAQYAAHKLLFDVSSPAQADANCTAPNGDSLSYSAAGLKGCSASLSCTPINNTGENRRLYDLIATATCGSDTLTAERSIAVKAIYE